LKIGPQVTNARHKLFGSGTDLTRSSATAEIARVGGHYAVQGRIRSLMLTPSENQYATSY